MHYNFDGTTVSATLDEPDPDENNDAARYEFSNDGALLKVLAIRVDTVEGISGSIVKNSVPLKILEAPWKPSERSLNLRESVTAREAIFRAMTANAAYVDELNGSVFDIPLFER